MATATVTLPGGLKPNINIVIGTDASKALTTAINAEFTAFKANPTVNEVATKAAGKAGFFNLLAGPTTGAVTTLQAGTNVEAIIAQGTAKDILIGGATTNLFVANKGGNSITTGLKTGVATVFGNTGNDTVNVVGKAEVYLGTGSNQVSLEGGNSVSLLGTGGTDLVSITTGDNTVKTAYATFVKVSATGNDVLDLAAGSKTTITGTKDIISLTGAGQSVTLSGASEKVTLFGADTISITAGSGDTISSTVGAHVTVSGLKSSDTLSFGGATTVKLATGDVITLTGKGATTVTEAGSATVNAGTSAGKLTFTAAINAKDSVVAGAGGGTLTGAKGASDTFKAGTGAVLMKHAAGGKDTFIGGLKDTMVGAATDKTGTDVFQFVDTIKNATHVIQSFTSGRDSIDLVGITGKALTAVIAAADKTFKSGTETITLADNTKITVSGLGTHHLAAKDFTS